MTSSPPLPTRFPDAPPPGSRRAEIALAAAEEFTRRGYHATRVEHIADRLAVTPGALYRYVPGKYAMFRDAVATLVGELDAATSGSDDLDHLVDSVTRATLTHRSRAALYRWQIR
ncbi:MAG: helix-turn-helix domain-containing protein, partial [Dietzia sp.]|nr:helix-turn-helix domain-containing protein [Dietzia sp.]